MVTENRGTDTTDENAVRIASWMSWSRTQAGGILIISLPHFDSACAFASSEWTEEDQMAFLQRYVQTCALYGVEYADA